MAPRLSSTSALHLKAATGTDDHQVTALPCADLVISTLNSHSKRKASCSILVIRHERSLGVREKVALTIKAGFKLGLS